MRGQRFEVLDGLRGIAALAVLLLHAVPHQGVRIAENGFLAVDFFFVLSGFVIAAAYSDRIGRTLGTREFVKLRLIRLYPLIVLGAFIGVLGHYKFYDPATLAVLFFAACLFVPTTHSPPEHGSSLIALNGVSWSLFWELIANLIYAAILPILSNALLGLIIVVSMMLLVSAAAYSGTMDIGSSWPIWWGGAPRVLFSFFVGVALHRLWLRGSLDQLRVPAWSVAGLLCLALMMPNLGKISWVYELIATIVIFPLVVAAGANATAGSPKQACVFLGATSYPMYILQGGITGKMKGLIVRLDLEGWAATGAAVALTAMYVAFCWMLLKAYDEPVRRALARRFAPAPRLTAQTAPGGLLLKGPKTGTPESQMTSTVHLSSNPKRSGRLENLR